ncbi:MAG: hypothetical protein GX131_00915 [candidate division WS1 bacterium]|nr:hypothetical protein [candidate division WS1 bacterium]
MVRRRARSAVERVTGGRVEIALLIAAVLIVTVGGLTMRLGPRWPRRLFFRGPGGIVIHHTATGGVVDGQKVDARRIGQWHARRGWAAEYRGRVYNIGYHYVILPDGTVQPGRPEWMLGAHTYGYNDYLGVCLVGNFDSHANPAGLQQPSRPTEEQMAALRALLLDLMRKYRLSPEEIHGHGELAATACPGDGFMLDALRESLRGQE